MTLIINNVIMSMLFQLVSVYFCEVFLLGEIATRRGRSATILLNPRDYTYSWNNQNVPFGFLYIKI